MSAKYTTGWELYNVHQGVITFLSTFSNFWPSLSPEASKFANNKFYYHLGFFLINRVEVIGGCGVRSPSKFLIKKQIFYFLSNIYFVFWQLPHPPDENQKLRCKIDDDNDYCFCGMADQEKPLRLTSCSDQFQKFSPSETYDCPEQGLNLHRTWVQNLLNEDV